MHQAVEVGSRSIPKLSASRPGDEAKAQRGRDSIVDFRQLGVRFLPILACRRATDHRACSVLWRTREEAFVRRTDPGSWLATGAAPERADLRAATVAATHDQR